MNLLTTFYIYPLSKPIVLSKTLKLFLDNARTDEEVKLVERYLIRSYKDEASLRLPIMSDEPVVTIEDTILRFRDVFAPIDSYVARMFDTYKRDSVFQFLARLWVFARYDDEGEIERSNEKHRNIPDELKGRSLTLLNDDHPLVKNSSICADYCHLLSLLVHSEADGHYFGDAFLEEEEYGDLVFSRKGFSFWKNFMLLGSPVVHYKHDASVKLGNLPRDWNWRFLPTAIETIRHVTDQIEMLFSQGAIDELLYVGNMLKVASDSSLDPRMKIVILTSIIEMLVTRNPDNNRFNVEDSISKQFQLKASVLIYLNDKSRNLNGLKQRLKKIYNVRSSIAHGNFGEIQRIEREARKQIEESYPFEEFASDLYLYLRAIIEEYLKDRSLVEFLKQS